MSRLAEHIDALAERDELAMTRAGAIAATRRGAAVELHSLCAAFVAEINGLLAKTQLALDPATYSPEAFQEDGPNIFQVNVRGRIVQIVFEATAELVSTEDFRVPYVLCGTVRCFNQQLIEQDLIVEHMLFYCLEKNRQFWRFFDERTYHTGPFDRDYLVALMEELV